MMEKLCEYADLFGENFPIFELNSKTSEEIEEIIDKCIKEGHPYEPNEELQELINNKEISF